MLDALTRLLAPVSRQGFLRDFYERQPLHVSGRPETHYADVFSYEALESLLWRHEGTARSFVRLHRDGRDIDPSRGVGRFDFVAWAIAEHRLGATIIVNNLEDYEPSVARFVRPIENSLLVRVSVSAYASPPHATAFAPHFDTHDVVILQVEGAKTFNTYDGVGPELPLASQAHGVAIDGLRELADPVRTVAGDTLYLPRGLVHDATTAAARSLHLSLGIHPLSVGDLIKSAVERATELSPALRRTVTTGDGELSTEPLGQNLSALSASARVNINVDDLIARWRAKLVATQRPLPARRLTPAISEDAITTASSVRRAEGATCVVTVDERRATIAFPGLSVIREGPQEPLCIELPAAAADALRFIASAADQFQIGEIPDRLSAKSKVLLAKRLVAEGLLVAD